MRTTPRASANHPAEVTRTVQSARHRLCASTIASTRDEHQHTEEIDDGRDLRVVETRLDEWEFRHDHRDHRRTKHTCDSSRLRFIHCGIRAHPSAEMKQPRTMLASGSASTSPRLNRREWLHEVATRFDRYLRRDPGVGRRTAAENRRPVRKFRHLPVWAGGRQAVLRCLRKPSHLPRSQVWSVLSFAVSHPFSEAEP